jgi:hypothetical protein
MTRSRLRPPGKPKAWAEPPVVPKQASRGTKYRTKRCHCISTRHLFSGHHDLHKKKRYSVNLEVFHWMGALCDLLDSFVL